MTVMAKLSCYSAHTSLHCSDRQFGTICVLSCASTNQTGTEDPFLLIAGLRGRACCYYYYFTRFVFAESGVDVKKKLIRSPGRPKSTACYASAAPGVIYYYPLRQGEGHQQTDTKP